MGASHLPPGLFGPVTDAASARREATLAVATCVVRAALMTMFFLVSRDQPVGPLHPSAWVLVGAAIFLASAWGIHKLSRVAAVAAVLFQALELFAGDEPGQWILMISLFFLTTGVVATFRYHRIRTQGDQRERAA
jgi:hypothetical protein